MLWPSRGKMCIREKGVSCLESRAVVKDCKNLGKLGRDPLSTVEREEAFTMN